MFKNSKEHFCALKTDNYFALIGPALQGMLAVTVIDAETEELIPNYTYIATDPIKFVDEIPSIFKNKFKAAVLCLTYYSSPKFANNIVFCETVRKRFKEINMPHFFAEDENVTLVQLLIAANISPKIDDLFTIVLVGHSLTIAELKYTQNGYQKRVFCLTPEMQEKNVEKFRQQIIGNENPKKIILHLIITGSPLFKMLRNIVLKSKKLIAIENNLEGYIGKCVVETIKWLKDKSFTQFHIIPTTITEFTITSKPDNFEKPVIIVNLREKLPVSKQFVVKDSNNVYVYFNNDKDTKELLYTLESSENVPVKKVTFKVDYEGFPTCDFKPFEDINACMEVFAEILNKCPFTLPIVVLFQNYSIISIKENDKYKCLDEWNETNGEIYIEFDGNKLIIKRKLSNVNRRLSYINDSVISFALKDLIKIMSSLPDQIVADKTWQYKITSDSNNPILLEFKTSDEILKVTPNLLMASLIKEQIKAIERETNVRPRKILFWVTEKYSEDEHKRIYLNFKESCKILSNAQPRYQIECEFPFVKL